MKASFALAAGTRLWARMTADAGASFVGVVDMQPLVAPREAKDALGGALKLSALVKERSGSPSMPDLATVEDFQTTESRLNSVELTAGQLMAAAPSTIELDGYGERSHRRARRAQRRPSH